MKTPETWIVYALKDPRTDEIRYVGWTSKTPEHRLSHHLSEAKSASSYKSRWLRSLKQAGVKATIHVLQNGSGIGWAEAEQHWIRFYRQNGACLTNASDGGEGNLGYSPPPEVREKISRANAGRAANRTPEHQANLIASIKASKTGKPRDRRSVEASAAKLRGIPRPAHLKAQWSAKGKGRVFSEETRARMSAARRARSADSPETIAKKRRAHQAYLDRCKAQGVKPAFLLWRKAA